MNKWLIIQTKCTHEISCRKGLQELITVTMAAAKRPRGSGSGFWLWQEECPTSWADLNDIADVCVVESGSPWDCWQRAGSMASRLFGFTYVLWLPGTRFGTRMSLLQPWFGSSLMKNYSVENIRLQKSLLSAGFLTIVRYYLLFVCVL